MPGLKKPHSILFSAIRWERIFFSSLAALLLLLFLTCVFFIGQSPIGIGIILSLVSLILLLVIFKLLFEVLKASKVVETELYQTILTKPEKIVWVYPVVTENSPYGVNVFSTVIIYFKLDNREHLVLNVRRSQLAEIMAALNELLPHSSFGFSKEKEQWYLAEPALLYTEKKNPEKKGENQDSDFE